MADIGPTTPGACIGTRKISQVVYLLLIVLGAFVALFLRFGGADLSAASGTLASEWAPLGSLSYTFCATDACRGHFAVYRVSFFLVSFFLLMAVATAPEGKQSSTIHQGFWSLKLVLLVLLGVIDDRDRQRARDGELIRHLGVSVR